MVSHESGQITAPAGEPQPPLPRPLLRVEVGVRAGILAVAGGLEQGLQGTGMGWQQAAMISGAIATTALLALGGTQQ
ncbi:hypothetical protein [Kitasatospora indigofera]|uniref:hypothetical protein n=1 Tax=Kitasatospora indigofera TaxID=67307 RepID=UPI00369D5EA0